MSGCSFTGHRVIDAGLIKPLTELVDRAIAYAYSRGCRDFYNGGAIGFDILTAQRVLLFRMRHTDIRLNMILPCRNQSDRWSDRDREKYEYVLSMADTVEYVADSYFDGCMMVRNRKLAERCDILIAYVSTRSGGSAQTVRMAKEKGKTVYNLYPHLVHSC